MIRSLTFGVGQRDGKYHAYWDAPDGRMEGPARDTEKEALADRDQAVQIAVMHVRSNMPDSVVNVGKVQ